MSEKRMRDFNEFARRYEINPTFAKKICQLEGYDIVFICDDSTSMNTPIHTTKGNNSKPPTRWDELRQIVSLVVDLVNILDSKGVDVYFLNSDPVLSVKKSSELGPIFAASPEGPTPIARVFREVLRDKQPKLKERKLLTILATDGVPTDNWGREDVASLRNLLQNDRNPPERFPITIIACTDDHQSMEYLNDWDKQFPYVDVVDDYRTEKREVLACQGANFPFSFGDYIVKILLGSIDPWFDNLDEKKVSLYDS